jgi:mono/diheme cytochrome c family protein
MRRGLVAGALALGVLAAGVLAFLPARDDIDGGGAALSAAAADDPQTIERGRYLALAGNCAACHTARGGAPYAGGRAIGTPFGAVYASNLTPDAATGIGTWTAQDFWRAMHHGKSKDGRLLYPAFPYPNFTRMPRADSDAVFAWLRTLSPVAQANHAHTLRFPYDQPVLLAGWRALYFKPGVFAADPARDAQWNRGAYLVQGPGHCNACHTARDALGGSRLAADLAGGMIPILGWYASPLNADPLRGLGNWDAAHVAALLRTGVSPRGAVAGPMGEVVYRSLQYLRDDDLMAMAVYLKSVPAPAATQPVEVVPEDAPVLRAGATLYERHCADCHGADGRGQGSVYPPLAGNRSVLAPASANPVRIVLNGGFPPGTAGNPRPYGMPPYRTSLGDAEVAAVVSFVRNAWGNRGGLVTAADVDRYRALPAD